MPGMNSGLSPGDPTLVAAFRSALLHQGAIALLMLVIVWLLWVTARTWRSAAVPGAGGPSVGGPSVGGPSVGSGAEARARWLLRTGFGVLWIFDGILQAQPKMAGGLATQVMEPIAASSPGWVQHLVNWGGTAWSYHPVQAGAASVWIQVGIGAWLIAEGAAAGRQVRAVAQSSQRNPSMRRAIAPWCSRADLNAATSVGSLGLRPEFMPGTGSGSSLPA